MEEEVKSIIGNEKEDGFLVKEKNNETIVCLHEKRKQAINAKITNKTIEYFINEFNNERNDLVNGVDTKAIIYRFLYDLLSTNI